MTTILITGGAGFIGSNFILYMIKKYPKYRIINFDLLTYAGNLENLSQIKNSKKYIFIQGDICNKNLVKKIFKKYSIKRVVHFAAESHVDNSIEKPEAFIKTNIDGTYTLIESAYKFWMKKPFQYKKGHKNSRFVHISTDEVYGSVRDEAFSETSPYNPNSPYSASKASSDMLVRSFYKTYGLNVNITNCSNNFGPRQHNEKLIPTVIKNALQGFPIPVYGDGKNIRDWLYVKDHCKAIDRVLHQAKSGETYNIGGDNEIRNIDLIKQICNVLDELLPQKKSYKQYISFVQDRHGHDKHYAINSTKIKKNLKWFPSKKFTKNLQSTIKWYIKEIKRNQHVHD